MARVIQQLLLVLLGGVVLRTALTDAHLAYVQPGFRPLLVGAGAVLLALAAAGLLGTRRHADDGHHHDGHHHDGHHHDGHHHDGHHHDGHHHDGHHHDVAPSTWLLVLPVAVLLLVAPPALGAFTAERQAQPIAVPAGARSSAALLGPDDEGADHRTLTLLEYGIHALAPGSPALTGRSVRLQGFALPRDGGGWYVARIRIGCCAADAVPIAVVLSGAPEDLEEGEWVE
ncbi:TIGR03943 family protein, partial [Blastococcus sp. KM273129]|nr:TIGR03943 family protein [Blastococcus sp. KM273129]